MIAGLVVAGGAGRRMDGADKAALVLGGVTLLDRVLTAARPVCGPLVVVGPIRPTAVAGVTFTAERRPGGGPVPAVAAGLAAAGAAGAVDGADVVLVLACDLPLLTTPDLVRLVDALGEDRAAAGAADGRGRPLPLLVAYRLGHLTARLLALGPDLAGLPARALLAADSVTVDLGQLAVLNVNTPGDLERARAAL